jgi:hypothetical protein
MSITTSTPNRRRRATLAAAGLAVAATAGLGFSTLGAAHAVESAERAVRPDPVHVKITVTGNSVPADRTPSVSLQVNDDPATCAVTNGATPVFELDVPKNAVVKLVGMSGCTEAVTQPVTFTFTADQAVNVNL